jgi:hypothetical protein
VGQSARLGIEIGGVAGTGSILYSLNEWHHIALVWTRNVDLKVYLDGSLAETFPAGPGSIAFCGSEPLRFGNQCGIGMTGAMDNIRYWSVARTADQIRDFLTVQFSPDQAGQQVGLIGSWTFESSSTSVVDGAGNCTDGTLGGTAAIVGEELPSFDDDGDGVVNAEDNCRNTPNPTQADCDNDGQGDACEDNTSDCNANGVLDTCDIASGTTPDADSNGIPDVCQPDCNLNGTPDEFEIAVGLVSDLNSDGTPDDCQGARMMRLDSPNLGAPSGAAARVWNVADLLPSETNVFITVDLRGDLNGQTEWADIVLNDSAPRRFFQADGSICPAVPDRAEIALTRAEWNALVGAAGQLSVRVECPPAVDGSECKDQGLTEIRIRYVGVTATGDCNGNQRLDVAETFDGTTPDCNANTVPDSCDIARGAAQDCNSNGVPDACELTATPALDCDANGIIDTCDLATGGTSIDCDQNGRIDSCQVTETPGTDCNGNLRPDACDVAGGTSADRDGDLQPDECQTVQVPGDFTSIQAAIDAAPASEMRIIAVAAGEFAGPVDFKGKPVVVRGAGAGQTVIAGTGGASVSVVRFMGSEPAISALERVSVRGGLTGTPLPSLPSASAGGGVLGIDAGTSIRDCVIESNTAGFGGGAYLLRCTGEVRNCAFRGNTATADGGGLQANQGSVRVIDTVVEGNVTNSRGGGLHLVQGTPTLTRVQVLGNLSSNLMGGISWFSSGSPTALLTLEGCTVSGNTALISYGGLGITDTGLAAASATLQGTTVCQNTPRPNVGGGRWSDNGSNTVCDCAGDLNLDGAVNGADLGLMLSSWGPCAATCTYDQNADGVINGADLGLLLSSWGACGG